VALAAGVVRRATRLGARLLGILAACVCGDARAAEPLSLARLTSPIRLDGRVDEDVWQQIEALPLVVYEPVYGGRASQRTEIRLAYDERYLYLGAQLFDDEPRSVRAGTLYRDRYAGDDTVGLIVDSFDDDRNARWFYTTPAGVRGDAAIADDMASGQPDWSWNGHWDAAAVETADGWSAEMRIPFATLGFSPRADGVRIGVGVYRWLARHNERHTWPDAPPRWARAYAKPSKLVDVQLSGVAPGRRLEITPYLLGGSVADRGGLAGARPTREAGFDLRRGLGSNLAVDVSVNTDFAQVEADDQKINLTRFPLFFPEKRPFFLQYADIFDFGWEGRSRLFHSRRLGLEAGEPARIWAGARLAGRAGPWDVGFLDMQAAESTTRGSENSGVLRVRRRSFGNRAILGSMLTTRAGAGFCNRVAAADLELRAFGDEFLVLKAARSASDGDRALDGADARAGTRVLARWERRRQQGLSYQATLAHAGAAFDADLGFEERREYGYAGFRIGHETLLGSNAPIRRLAFEVAGEAYRRNAGGRVESASLGPEITLDTHRGDSARLSSTWSRENVVSGFALPQGASIPAGSFGFHELALSALASSGRRLRPGATLRAGSFYDGRRYGAGPTLSWYVSRHLELAAEYEREALRFAARGQRADTHLVRFRLQAARDVHASATLFAQYNSVTRAWGVNVRARYHFREGTDLWLVYDDDRRGPLIQGSVRLWRGRVQCC
jgi:hypothetical protein